MPTVTCPWFLGACCPLPPCSVYNVKSHMQSTCLYAFLQSISTNHACKLYLQQWFAWLCSLPLHSQEVPWPIGTTPGLVQQTTHQCRFDVNMSMHDADPRLTDYDTLLKNIQDLKSGRPTQVMSPSLCHLPASTCNNLCTAHVKPCASFSCYLGPDIQASLACDHLDLPSKRSFLLI